MNEPMASVSGQLTRSLALDRPPVQVSYLDAAPDGVAEHPGGVPSVCTFFAEGRDHTFYAGLPAHEDCEVGAFVLGIPPTGAVADRLQFTIGTMHSEGYLAPGEEARIPRNATPPKFVAYGPLGSLPMDPTGVLLFARPVSVMLALEAARFQVPVMGRPMCSILPSLRAGAPVVVSAGCTGSRIYTSMGDDRMIVGIRGDHVRAFATAAEKIHAANAAVGAEDRARKAASSRPYVEPSRGPAPPS